MSVALVFEMGPRIIISRNLLNNKKKLICTSETMLISARAKSSNW